MNTANELDRLSALLDRLVAKYPHRDFSALGERVAQLEEAWTAEVYAHLKALDDKEKEREELVTHPGGVPDLW